MVKLPEKRLVPATQGRLIEPTSAYWLKESWVPAKSSG